jgi:hypothetical protein
LGRIRFTIWPYADSCYLESSVQAFLECCTVADTAGVRRIGADGFGGRR